MYSHRWRRNGIVTRTDVQAKCQLSNCSIRRRKKIKNDKVPFIFLQFLEELLRIWKISDVTMRYGISNDYSDAVVM